MGPLLNRGMHRVVGCFAAIQSKTEVVDLPLLACLAGSPPFDLGVESLRARSRLLPLLLLLLTQSSLRAGGRIRGPLAIHFVLMLYPSRVELE
jgi:hypothetical protein